MPERTEIEHDTVNRELVITLADPDDTGPLTSLVDTSEYSPRGYSAIVESSKIGPRGGQVLVDRTVEQIAELRPAHLEDHKEDHKPRRSKGLRKLLAKPPG